MNEEREEIDRAITGSKRKTNSKNVWTPGE